MNPQAPASPASPASPGRRRCLRWGTALGALAVQGATGLWPGAAWAQVGPGQLEEPLVDSVRTALTAAVRESEPMVPEFDTTTDYLHYARWKAAMAGRLHARKRRRHGSGGSGFLGGHVRSPGFGYRAYGKDTGDLHRPGHDSGGQHIPRPAGSRRTRR